MREVKRNLSRKGSAPYLERAKSHSRGIDASVNRGWENSPGIGNGRLAQNDGGVGTARPLRGLERTPKSMRVVQRASGKGGKSTAERLDSSLGMKAREGHLCYTSRVVIAKRENLVNRELKKMKKIQCSLMISRQLMQKRPR